MHSFSNRFIAAVVAACFFVYTIVGCGNSREFIQHLDKYDAEPYANFAIFPGVQDDVFHAALRALQVKGYILTTSEPHLGTISGELSTEKIIPEERKAAEVEEQNAEKRGFFETVFMVLGLILLFGIILALTADDDEKKESESQTVHHVVHEETVKSYKYVVSLNLVPVGEDSTEISISAVRQYLENGFVVAANPLVNKYFNYSFFQTIEFELRNEIH